MSEMKVITLLNEKGGVGKTTLASAIAALLAKMGFRVCLIDTDAQGHATDRLKIAPEDGFFALLGQRQAWQQVLRTVSPDIYNGTDEHLLRIVPGFSKTRLLVGKVNARYLIARLKEVEDTFDFVIVDTSPAIGDIHAALFVASDYIIIPTECTRLPVKAVVSTIGHIKNAHENVPDDLQVASILGILPTKFNGRKSVHYQNLGWLDGRYSEIAPVFHPMRYLTDWEKAESKRLAIHKFSPRSSAANDLRIIVDEILDRLGVADV